MSRGSWRPHTLVPGVHWDGSGVHAVLPSRHATAVALCLFATPQSRREMRRIPLMRQEGDLWHAYVPDIAPGQLYGYRVDGPWDPAAGHRFNLAKLLVDPYALAITGEPRFCPSVFPPLPADPGQEPPPDDAPGPDNEDSAPAMPRCVVVNPAFDWGDDHPPRIPWRDTVIYECHVRALTATHPDVPPSQRGTYLGLAAPPVIAHLQSLGVTAVELLPVHQIASERHLLAAGRRNAWGYSTLGYFAPHAGYASDVGAQVREWKTLVRTLHRAGIEVILDVVYNHTAEGDRHGPTLSFKGIDNARYYRLQPADRRRYEDVTGCGNTLDIRRAPVRQLILASLRYWVEVMHVDGFRFDLAATLTRNEEGEGEAACFFETICQDPVLRDVKLIAEPWDLGTGGYRLGRFPTPWAEWNDRYRNDVRRFWRAEPATAASLATRLAGSSDLFAPVDKPPTRSLNFITCHDGFPLADLVAYEQKHNKANGEENRDGNPHNLSRNWGVEGPTDDPAIRRRRARRQRSLLATLALSRGVPMLLYGDEVGRTQGGNNNAYCQDNPTSWFDWDLDDERRSFLAFTRRLFALRRRFPVFRRATFYRPESTDTSPGTATPSHIDNIRWLSPEGQPLEAEAWHQSPADTAFAARLRSPDRDHPESPPRPLLLLLNGSEEPVAFHLPSDHTWQRLLDTERPGAPDPQPLPPGTLTLTAGTLQLLAAGRIRQPGAKRERTKNQTDNKDEARTQRHHRS